MHHAPKAMSMQTELASLIDTINVPFYSTSKTRKWQTKKKNKNQVVLYKN